MSANAKVWMHKKTRIKRMIHINMQKCSFILIGDKDSNYTSVKDLKDNDKLALGEVKTVPAGRYVKQYLDNNN
ncbi:hypothetical protein ACVXZZ_03805 [Staphylococcus aureus]